MRTLSTGQPIAATPYVLGALGHGLRQYLWPPLVTLLVCLFVLTGAYATPRYIVQDVGVYAPLLSGLYADERNQQLTYAYTEGDAVLALPHFGRGIFVVSLTAGAPDEHDSRRVLLRLGQERYPLGSLQPVRAYHLLVQNNGPGDADLHIESEAAPVGTDHRNLGILLDRLSVTTLRPMGAPYSVYFTVLVSTALLSLISINVLRSNHWRMCFVLGGSLAICLAYGFGRGTWDVPVWWLYRTLGFFVLALFLARFDRWTRPTVPWFWHVALVVGAAGLLISRRPDALLNAQFWAEDGHRWYQDAYTAGPLRALLMPHASYFHTLPRLVSAFSLWFPLVLAPLIFNLVAIGVQLLPVFLLLSSRYAHVIPSVNARLLLALAYIAVPNREVHANLTNAQWHLALTAAMIILAQPSTRWGWRCFDVAVVALTSVSGPFALVLAPMSLLRGYVQRDRWLLSLGLVLSVGALIQLRSLLMPTGGPRLAGSAPLGASLSLFARIVGGQVFAHTVLGPGGYSWLGAQALWTGVLPMVVTVGGLGLLGYALWNGPLELRLFTLFAVWILVGTLLMPVTVSAETSPPWEVLAQPGLGLRYWRIPMLAFLLVLGYLATRAPARTVRWMTGMLLLVAAVGNLYAWRYEPWADLRWRDHAQAFTTAAPGTEVSIPIHPDGWTLDLVKH